MNNISKDIIGYELVKDCVDAYGEERTFCEYLFAVKRNSEDLLNDICEVRPNTDENRRIMKEKFDFDHYIIWCGTIWESRRKGGKVVEFYWS